MTNTLRVVIADEIVVLRGDYPMLFWEAEHNTKGW